MRVGIVGRMAIGKAFFDGQTVSTRLWRNELIKRFHGDESKVFVVDTYNYKKRFIPILLQWGVCLCSCSHIVVMLSGNGLTFFLPLLYGAHKFLGKKIFHRVIGGELDTYVRQHPKSVKYFNSFEVNWVQSNKMIEKLENLGVKNSRFMENFRDISPVQLKELKETCEKPYRFCTFSRVSKAKGIDLAIEAIDSLNRKAESLIAILDIYGPIEKDFASEFQDLLKKSSKWVTYQGCIPSEEAVSVLKNYDFHLFPTTWKGEGFPGTLIDCYNAGLPTIGSTWAYNNEFIEDGKTGYLYNWKNPEELQACIEKAILNINNVYKMRINCLNKAAEYSAEAAMKKVMDALFK